MFFNNNFEGYDLDWHNDRIYPADLFCYRVWFKLGDEVFPKVSNQDNLGDLFEEYLYHDVVDFERLEPREYLNQKKLEMERQISKGCLK